MLIKNVSRKGDATPLSPEESLPHAILRALQSMNSSGDKIFWIKEGSIKKDSYSHLDKVADKTWTASSVGKVFIGYTDVKTDTFYEPREFSYAIEYRSEKDDIGLPDTAVDKFSMTAVETDPSALMGFPDKLEAANVTPANPTLSTSKKILSK